MNDTLLGQIVGLILLIGVALYFIDSLKRPKR